MDLSKIHIRPFLPREWPDFKEKRLHALKSMPHLFTATYEMMAEKPDEFWIETVGGDRGKVFGLFDDLKLVGITGIFKNWRDESGRTAHLVMSYIDPDYRGHGLSQLLYKVRLDWARDNGFEKATVSHRDGNEASKAANQKFGFEFTGSEMIDFADGPALDHRYELKLNPL